MRKGSLSLIFAIYLLGLGMGFTMGTPAILLSFVEAAPGAVGFANTMLCAGAFCLVALLCLLFYK